MFKITNLGKQNSIINILKFLFSICIVGLHLYILFSNEKSLKYFSGSAIFVEWFYILIGYTIAKKILNLQNTNNCFHTTCEIIRKRVLSILPYYFLSTTVALILKLYNNMIEIKTTWDVYKIIYEYLMLEMWSGNTIYLNGTSWFLSSLYISLLILVPLLYKFRKYFSKSAIIISIALYIFMYITDGHIFNPEGWTLLGYKGNLRAIAAICLGIFGYDFSLLFKNIINKYKIVFSILLIIANASVLYAFMLYHTDEIYFIMPFIFMILISFELSKNSNILIPDCHFIRCLGTLSMIIFMNHYYIIELVNKLYNDYSNEIKIQYSIILISIVVITSYIFVYYLKKLLHQNKKHL